MTDDEVGARVRTLRQRHEWTQVELVRRCVLEGQTPGWNQSTLAKVESGQRSLRVIEGVYLARALGVSLDRLASGS